MGFMVIRKKRDLQQLIGVYETMNDARFIMSKNAKKKDFGKQFIRRTSATPTAGRLLKSTRLNGYMRIQKALVK